MKASGEPLTIPTEEAEQTALFEWAARQAGRHPELGLLHAIPNGGKRGKAEAARMKMAGVKAGVPDMFLPVPRGSFHGLYIELKRRKGGRVSPEQAEWLERLSDEGYFCQVCKGWEEAAELIREYLGRK